MKKLLPVLLLLLAGCHNDLGEGRVERDFREIVGKKYPDIKIVNLERIGFGDGWDDGVEVTLLFKRGCDKSVTSQDSVEGVCSGETRSMQMEISYQRDPGGNWQVLATSIEAH